MTWQGARVRYGAKTRGRGEDESALRIALQRKGAGKKLLRPLRLTSPSAAGVARAASASTVR